VPPAVLDEILAEANRSPSNCNTQPWLVHVVSGSSRKELSAALRDAYDEDRYSLDFTFDPAAYTGPMGERRHEQGRCFYEALSMGRDDAEGRRLASRKNLDFYGAPHAAFLFTPVIGDCVRVAADIGMYAQTFLLALAARGLGGIPQTILGYFADTVREVLEITSEVKLLFGISFGAIDETDLANSVRLGRDPTSATVTLHI
jgi:nitroreductase